MITLKKFENGFEYIEVQNESAKAKIALQGAHIFEYKSKGDELLWLSDISDFEIGKAIRGGVPICWPSFGMNNPNLAQHGFARTAMFELLSSIEIDAKSTQLTFGLTHTKQSLDVWNFKYELEFKVLISETLVMELKTINKDTREFRLSQALHSYFKVSNILDARVKGLENKPCFNALEDSNSRQNGEITFDAEFDSVFQEVSNELLLEDKSSVVSIQNEGSSSVVVWNPWIEKCSRMSAMSSEAYKEFVCVESANAFEDFKVIKPDESHTLKATIKKFDIIKSNKNTGN